MRVHLRHAATAMMASTALVLMVASPAAGQESLGVPIVSSENGVYGTPAEVNFSDTALKTALYVDSNGAAHIAYVVPDSSNVNSEVALCTVAAGASTCAPNGVLTTDGTKCSDEISSLKYLPDGNGAAVLAVSFSELYENSCSSSPFPGETPPYSETEVFQPGSTTGTAIGTVFDEGGQNGGDEIYVPDDDGIDIVGQYNDYDWPPPGTDDPANYYEFESFTSPSSTDSGPTNLGGVESGANLPGWWPAGVTELANGDTGVLAYYFDQKDPSETNPETAPVGIYVQPAAGGSFGTIRPLGISGPVESDFTPSGATYLVDGVSTAPTSTQDVPEDLELYDFQGESLQWLGTIGATDDNFGTSNTFGYQTEWDSMPPSYEDADGDMYVAWYANGTTDACPGVPSGSPTGNDVYGCVMYRQIAPGGVFGPKVVLSEDYGFGGDTDNIGDIDQIAADPDGDGWVLVWREQTSSSDYWELYAEPLSASATVPTPPTVTGTVTAVPLTCSGSGSCSLTVTLDNNADVSHAVLAQDRAARTVLASERVELRGGTHRTVHLRLNRTGRALARRARGRLAVRLVVVQSLGLTHAPSVAYDGTLTLR
jgi:hypothetical protein